MNNQKKSIEEQKLLEILDLAQKGEKQLKNISKLASELASKSEQWYQEELNKKESNA